MKKGLAVWNQKERSKVSSKENKGEFEFSLVLKREPRVAKGRGGIVTRVFFFILWCLAFW